MEHIRARTDTYFARQWQRRLVATTNGILADNIANDSGDMVIDVSSASIAGQTAATLFNRDAFVEALYTMGDAADGIEAIAVHSSIMAQMVKNQDIDFIPDATGTSTIPTYLGKRVIVDDGLTVTAGATDGFVYTSVLLGSSAFGYGVGSPTMPVEIEREAAQGNGGGIETLWVRNSWILHPFGFQATGTPAGNSFTQAELALATSFDRVLERKQIKLAYLKTN